jgi:hypothetical protein
MSGSQKCNLNPVAALLTHIKSELTCHCKQRMITGKRMSPDRVKRSQDVQFAASDRSSIAKREDFSLHGKDIPAPKERGQSVLSANHGNAREKAILISVQIYRACASLARS